MCIIKPYVSQQQHKNNMHFIFGKKKTNVAPMYMSKYYIIIGKPKTINKKLWFVTQTQFFIFILPTILIPSMTMFEDANLCIYIYICILIYTYIHICCIYEHIHTYIHTYIYIHIQICVSISTPYITCKRNINMWKKYGCK